MAELSTTDRQRVWRGLQRYWSNLRTAISVSKSELQTTVNETDSWIDDNLVSYNSALTYGASFTPAQKTLIFCCVASSSPPHFKYGAAIRNLIKMMPCPIGRTILSLFKEVGGTCKSGR